MIKRLENATLRTDLDCQDFELRNMQIMFPPPPPLVDTDVPEMTNARAILDGTVTDESVAVTAAIAQSKLLFNDDIPAPWLGTGDNQAAPGNLVELLANKGQPGGYVALDTNGLLPAANVDVGVETGTVNSVALVMPAGYFEQAGSPIEDSGTFTVTWDDVPNASWFGRGGLSPSNAPIFNTTEIPVSLVPDLDAAKFTTGTFDVERLPPAGPMGVDHEIGILPDPGAHGAEDEYLGRDMQWHSFTQNIGYQPTVPNVLITNVFPAPSTDTYSITIRSNLPGSVLFYRVNGGSFIEVHSGGHGHNVKTIIVTLDDFIEAYAAKAGYNNSTILGYVVQTPSPTL